MRTTYSGLDRAQPVARAARISSAPGPTDGTPIIDPIVAHTVRSDRARGNARCPRLRGTGRRPDDGRREVGRAARAWNILRPRVAHMTSGPGESPARPRRWRRRLGRLVVVAIAATALGAVLQVSAIAWDARRVHPPGVLVDVGGHRLHLSCTGEGSPAVVLEHGGAGSALAWFRVQPDVARVTRVCSYDRAGLGWSDASDQPRDAQHIGAELHALVHRTGPLVPFVLAGWSYGGLFARAYAADYPEDLAGLVLIDATPTTEWTRSAVGVAQHQSEQWMYAATRALARVGLLRLLPNPMTSPPPGLTPEQKQQWKTIYRRTRFWDTVAAESEAITLTMKQVDEAGGLGDLPLVVVTAGANAGVDGQWQAEQVALRALSSRSAHVVVENATHASLWAEPEASRATASAIVRLVEDVRAGAGARR